MNIDELAVYETDLDYHDYRLVAIVDIFQPACLLLKSVSMSFSVGLTLPVLEIQLSDEDDFHPLPGHSWRAQLVDVTGTFYNDAHYSHAFGRWSLTLDRANRTISYYLN